MLLRIRPPMSGSNDVPLCVALTPWTTCMYSGMNMTTPRNAMLTTNEAMIAARKVLIRKSPIDRIGSAVRISMYRKTISEMTDTTSSRSRCSRCRASSGRRARRVRFLEPTGSVVRTRYREPPARDAHSTGACL